MAANRHVFLDISIDGEAKGKIVVELFDDEVPKTAENFHALCTGEKGENLHFKGSRFISIIPNFRCHGGDGIGSIYGSKFPVEHSHLKRDFGFRGGLVCMALTVPDNNEPYTSGSGFFITTTSTPWLSSKHTIFGQVVEGADVLRAIEQVGTISGTPKKEVKISNCGDFVRKASWAKRLTTPAVRR